MGSALAAGAISSAAIKSRDVLVFDHSARGKSNARRWKLRQAANAAEVVRKCPLIFLCVKPQGMAGLLEEIGRGGSSRSLESKCFVSIAAGVSTRRIEVALGGRVSVLRVMPNTPALLKAGMSAVSRGRWATASQENAVIKILSSTGQSIALPEKYMDAVTAVSGSGPAYVFYLAEALIEGAMKVGLPASAARLLVHQTVFGAGSMLARRSEDAGTLRVQVTSPGGTTAAALAIMEKGKFKALIHSAVRAAAERSAELSKI